MNRVVVIGSGFAGLSASALLAKQGLDVTLLEKNADLGGRARVFREAGFTFDMGPSWYWMPDVFSKFFDQFGVDINSKLNLVKLDPGFQMVFAKDDVVKVPADYQELRELFESIEKGGADALDRFMKDAEYKYQVGMNDMATAPSLSIMEFMRPSLAMQAPRLRLFSSLRSHVAKSFKDERLRLLMEFPSLFLGTSPETTPALYSLMNYAGFKQGTFYPMGGFGKLVDAFVDVAKEQGVNLRAGDAAREFKVDRGRVLGVVSDKSYTETDAVLAAADYHHVESQILPEKYRSYSSKYWDSRVMSPSSLLFYLGVDEKLDGLEHHNLFFDEDYDTHASEIYGQAKWPTKPLFYACCPSRTDASVAPEGKENLFILMPLASGLSDSEDLREEYYQVLLDRLEDFLGKDVRGKVIYKRSYCLDDFKSDYNAFKGNAYGLANTLRQTAFLKPRAKSKKLKNLFYAGQLTVPGPGVPPAIISGEISTKLITKELQRYETVV